MVQVRIPQTIMMAGRKIEGRERTRIMLDGGSKMTYPTVNTSRLEHVGQLIRMSLTEEYHESNAVFV
jgi:hypothetical protein